MNVLVLNLTRFGDLLQSQAAIADMQGLGWRAGLVCLENFSAAAPLLRGVSHVAPLPGAALLAALESRGRAGSAPGWPLALAALADWRAGLRAAFPFDLVCNLTPSVPARLLARYLAGGGPCAGFFVDAHGFGVNGNAWAAFLQGASQERGVSPFNVADLFRKAALPVATPLPGPGAAALNPASGALRASARDRLKALAPPGCAGFVALQLGASEERRRWPTESFAALGERLWRELGLCPLLLGSPAERPLAERYAALAGHPLVDLCGRTGLDELAAVLPEARLLVTNDTGTMHLAAGLGVPVLAVFLATAQPFDTGPYQEGACCLEPDLPCHPCAFGSACPFNLACRQAVSPDFAAALAVSRLRDGVWTLPPGRPQARVWLSQADALGFMGLRSLSGHENEERAIWLAWQRHYLRRFLDGEGGEGFAAPPPGECPALPGALGREISAAAAPAGKLTDLLLQQGRVLAVRPAPHMRERFLATWRKVYDALRREPRFAALALLWMQETQGADRDFPAVLAAARRFARLLECLAEK